MKYAADLLARVASDPNQAFHIGGFVAGVIDAMVPIDPHFAIKMDAALRNGGLRVELVNQYGATSFLAAIWRVAGIGNKDCMTICRRILDGSNSDEEIMYHSITAQAEGALPALVSICEELLKSPKAKDRCLAVSALAWVPTDANIHFLDRFSLNDTSGWVRAHAAWAAEMARHEASVRRHYSITLQYSDVNAVLARMQVMQPALTPSLAGGAPRRKRKAVIF